MTDGHIHLKHSNCTPEHVQRFVDKIVEMTPDEIWLLSKKHFFMLRC